MLPDVLYKESMYWISQFQTFRNETQRIKISLLQEDLTGSEDCDKTTIKELLHSIVAFTEHLDDTEEIILASINNGTTYWPGRNHSYDFSKKAESTDELFDRVKLNYNVFIELQRSASILLHHSS